MMAAFVFSDKEKTLPVFKMRAHRRLFTSCLAQLADLSYRLKLLKLLAS